MAKRKIVPACQHPGPTIKEIIEALNLTVAQAADQLGIGRVMLSRVINQRAGVSVNMALRLEEWLRGTKLFSYCNAEYWLTFQYRWDLQEARRNMPKVTRASFNGE